MLTMIALMTMMTTTITIGWQRSYNYHQCICFSRVRRPAWQQSKDRGNRGEPLFAVKALRSNPSGACKRTTDTPQNST